MKIEQTDIGNTLRDISNESDLNDAEKESLRLIAKDYDKLQADAKYYKTGVIQTVALSNKLQLEAAEEIRKIRVENEQLKEKHETEIKTAKILCQIYFEIAEQHISGDEIRRIRDEKFVTLSKQEKENGGGRA